MPFLPRSLPRLRPTRGPWWPLAVASTLWLLLLLFGSASITSLASHGSYRPLAVLSPWQAALVLELLGFWAGVALLPASPSRRSAAALGLALFWAAVLVGYQERFDLPNTPPLLGLGLAGLVLGLAAGAMAGPRLRRWTTPVVPGQPLAALALGCALIAGLIPLTPDHPLTAPWAPGAPSDLARQIPQQVYGLIKGAMLWVPIGFVFAVGDLGRGLRLWVPAFVIAFFLTAWPFFPGLRVLDLMEILCAPVGLWLGLWVVERTGIRAQTPVEERVTGPSSPPFKKGGALGWPERRGAPTPKAQGGFPSRWHEHLAMPSFPHPLALPPALALLGLAAWGWWEFPRFQVALGVALLLYLALLLAFRHAWLVLIPALLPVLDLAPWTGRFYLDESDLFLLVTLGAALLHRRDPFAGPFLPRPITVLATLFAATTLTALLLGLFPLSPLDANAFTSYFSHYNALRVGKGFAWGLGGFLLLRWTTPRGSDLPARGFTAGMLLGLLGVILIGARERWQFADLLDFSAAYRLTAGFSSMHTGDAHLPAYLALAVPFVWLWMARQRRPEALALGLALFAGAIYLVIATVTRASVLALALELPLLAVFWFRGLRGGGGGMAVGALAFVAMAAVAGGLLYLGTQGRYFQQRLATVSEDADTRLTHWNGALRMMDQDLATQTFGMGLGRFPETYLQHSPTGSAPGNFRYAQDGGNSYLALGSGETLYLAQRVVIEPRTRYHLAFDIRGEAPVLRLTIPLCEKHLLDSRRCQWQSYELPGGPGWQHREATLDSGPIGEGNGFSRRPVELFLYNGEKNQLLAIDNLSLRDPDGRELLRNGNFSAGGDGWFFKTHDHLAWHIKHVWVSLLFEQGWLGLIAFNLLLLAVLIHLWGPAWRGQPVPAATLTALLGFLTVGFFASPFDAPRLTALFLAIMAVGLHATPAAPTVGPSRRSRRQRR